MTNPRALELARDYEYLKAPDDVAKWLVQQRDRIIKIDAEGKVTASVLSGVAHELDQLRTALAERDAEIERLQRLVADVYEAVANVASITMQDAKNDGAELWLEKAVIRADEAKKMIEAAASPTAHKGGRTNG